MIRYTPLRRWFVDAVRQTKSDDVETAADALIRDWSAKGVPLLYSDIIGNIRLSTDSSSGETYQPTTP
jgi:hypothetical protein